MILNQILPPELSFILILILVPTLIINIVLALLFKNYPIKIQSPINHFLFGFALFIISLIIVFLTYTVYYHVTGHGVAKV